MTPDAFRTYGHALVDWIAAYREVNRLGFFGQQVECIHAA